MIKTKRVAFRLSDDDYTDLKTKAEMAGLTVSAFCQQLVKGVKIKYPVLSTEDSREVVSHLGKIGGNINQIAHWLNKGNNPLGMQEDLKLLREYVGYLWDFVTEKRR